LEKEIKRISKRISKNTKSLPLITYTSSTYIIPTKVKENLRKRTEQFMSGGIKITVPIQTLALPQRHGGFNVANITLYADLFLIRHIQKYCKHRAEETPTTPNLALTEFNIGQQISNLFQLRQNNFLPHATRPSITYTYISAIIKSTNSFFNIFVKKT